MYFNVNCKHFTSFMGINECNILGFKVFGYLVYHQNCNPLIAENCKHKEPFKRPLPPPLPLKKG